MFSITNFGTIATVDDFPTTCEVGDILYCNEDNKVYEYYDNGPGKPFGWREKEFSKEELSSLGLTVYDINRMVIQQLPSLITEKQLAPAKRILNTYLHKEKHNYYMLLCNDTRYYTVFNCRTDAPYEGIIPIIIECLQDQGVIQQICPTEKEDAIECWIKNNKGCFMYLLFDYDWGVVPCAL